MSTRGRIGLQQDKRIIASYAHWDNYPAGVGYTLIEHWTDPKKVLQGIMLGDASKWSYITGDELDFEDRTNPLYEVQNVYYGRDRGEKNCGYRIYKDEADYIKHGFNSGEQFIYLGKKEGEKNYMGKPQLTWYYTEMIYGKDGKYVAGDFKLLEPVAVKDYINMLKESYKKVLA